MKERTQLDIGQIRTILSEKGMKPASVKGGSGGGSYLLLSESDIGSKLAPEFTRILMETGYVYIPGRQACPQFAGWCIAWTYFFHARQPGPLSYDGVAIGKLEVPDRAHDLVVAIHESDAEVCYPQAYEPQRGQNGVSLEPVELTLEEWKNAEADF